MAATERVIVFGDTTGIKPKDIQTILEATHPTLVGIYPRHDEQLDDTVLTEEAEQTLINAGIPNPPHPVICSSTEELISNMAGQLPANNQSQLYIVDRQPNLLIEGIRKSPEKDLFRSATLLALPPANHIDYTDPETGVRVVSFPDTPYRFPTHPTPDS